MDMDALLKVGIAWKGGAKVYTPKNEFKMKFYWRQPRSGIILDDGLETGSADRIATGVTVQDTKLRMQFRDKFGNLAFFYNNRNYKNNRPANHIYGNAAVDNIQPGVRFRPQCSQVDNEIGVYACTLRTKRAGDWTL